MPAVGSKEVFEGLLTAYLANRPTGGTPWRQTPQEVVFEPELDVLTDLTSLAVRQGASTRTGRLALAVDAWVAHELRRAGFSEDEVWPRPAQPRVLDPALVPILNRNDVKKAPSIANAIRNTGRASANMLGAHYEKQVDVIMSRWDRGAELMVSTKTMTKDYGNNLKNRFEEFVGDWRNLNRRFPLSALGIVFVTRSTVEDEPNQQAFMVDMLKQLDDPELYDSVCLLALEWDDANFGSWKQGWGNVTDTDFPALLAEPSVMTLRSDLMPAELAPARALEALVRRVLDRCPEHIHPEPRDRLANPI